MAANATFALKPGVWFLRVASSSLLLIRDENLRRRQAENPVNRVIARQRGEWVNSTGNGRWLVAWSSLFCPTRGLSGADHPVHAPCVRGT
jgi:hypothetical protein